MACTRAGNIISTRRTAIDGCRPSAVLNALCSPIPAALYRRVNFSCLSPGLQHSFGVLNVLWIVEIVWQLLMAFLWRVSGREPQPPAPCLVFACPRRAQGLRLNSGPCRSGKLLVLST